MLCLEQRKLFQPLGTLNVVLLLLLSLEAHLQLLLLLLQLLNLLCHDVIRIHLSNSVLVQLAKHLLPDVGLSKLLDLVLVVLRLDRLHLLLSPLLVTDLSFLSKALSLLLLLLGQLVPLLLQRLLHLRRIDGFQPFLPLLNDLVPRQQTLVVPHLALMVSLRDLGLQLRRLDLKAVRVDGIQRLVEDVEHRHELGANLLAGHRLHMGSLRHFGLLRLCQVGSEVDARGAMVNAHLHVIVPCTFNNQTLHVMAITEDGERNEALHGDALVHLSHLLQEPDQGHIPKGLGVLLDCRKLLRLLDHIQPLINFTANAQGVEIHFEPVVEVTELLRGASDDAKPDAVLQQGESGGWLVERQEHSQPCHLLGGRPVCLYEPVKLGVLAWQGDTEAGSQHPAGHLGKLLLRDVLLHLSRQLEVLEHRRGMEQDVTGLPEDERQLLVVVCHHLRLEHLLGERHESMDVLHGFVSLLPQLHVDGSVELNQPRVQVHLLGLGVVQVDRVCRRVLVLDDQIQMVPEFVTELPELRFPLVLEAKLESLLSDVVIETLHTGVGSKQLKTLTVGFPQKLDPGHKDSPVRPILGSFSGHCAEHDHLRSCKVVQIVDVNLVNGLLLRSLRLLLRHGEVALHHRRQARHIRTLAHVPVLEEPLFRHMGLLEVDAELQVAEHDLLDQLFAVGVVPLLALDNIIESVQGSAWFTNLDELIRLGDGVLRALEVARPHPGRYSRLQVGAENL